MEKRGILTEFLEIPEDLNPREQVKTLQTIFEQVPAGCQLTIDMTHGFRAVPVMLSSAIGFLQSTGHARVEHVLYGAHDQTFSLAGSEYAPIYDMVEFYQITELAEGCQDWWNWETPASSPSSPGGPNNSFRFRMSLRSLNPSAMLCATWT